MKSDWFLIDKVWLKQLKIYSLSSTIDFGKYIGLTINEILYKDIDYFRFCIETVKYFILDNNDEKFWSGVFFDHPQIKKAYDEQTIKVLFEKNEQKLSSYNNYLYNHNISLRAYYATDEKSFEEFNEREYQLEDNYFEDYYNDDLDLDQQDERFYERDNSRYYDDSPYFDDESFPEDYEYHGTLIDFAQNLNVNSINLLIYNDQGLVKLCEEKFSKYLEIELLRSKDKIDGNEKIKNLHVIGFQKNFVVINEEQKKQYLPLLIFSPS